MKSFLFISIILAVSAMTAKAEDCGQFCELSFWKDPERPTLDAHQIEGRDLDALLPVHERWQFTLAQLAQLSYRWDDVVFLLEAGADPNVFSSKGRNLFAMVATQHLPIHAHMGKTEREEIIATRMERLAYLLEKGADPSRISKDGQGVIHGLAGGDGFLLAPLIAHLGLDVNERDAKGWAPIHIAATDGYYGPVYALAKIGADINIALENGETPLHLAAGRNHLNYNTVPALLEYRADPNARDNNGRTPLHALAGGEEPDVIALDCLFVGGAKLDVLDKNGDTPLHLAVRAGHGYVVSALMALGADRGVVNLAGETPWDVFQNLPADVEYFGSSPLALSNTQPVTFTFSSITGYRKGAEPVCELTYRK